MKAYEIKGNPTINVTINVQGSKNSSLAIIVASLLCKDVVILSNVPKIKDIYELLMILKKINVNVSFIDNNLIIDSTNITYKPLLMEEIKKFRASYYFIGTFLSLFNEVEIYYPGGCNIGKRPIDQHIKGLSNLDVSLLLTSDVIKASAKEKINGGVVNFDIPSVGATVNILLSSIFASQKTIIKNAAKEPEIVDLINFLNKMGANIVGEGTSVIIVNPTIKLNKTNYKVMSDRVVCGTYLIYGALFAKKLTLKNVDVKDNYALINQLINLNVNMDIRRNEITIYGKNEFDKANIKTGVYPLFPSDLQQIMSVYLFAGTGVSLVEETLFENRFAFLDETKKMNGKFLVVEDKALIIPSKLSASSLSCKDLRGGAALLLACLLANGTSILKNVEFIERGYENIVEVLQSVNVNIKEIELHEA